MTPFTLPPSSDHAKKRFDKLLAEAFPQFSRARLQALIEAGEVRIDGEVETSASRKIKAEETITLTLPDPVAASPVAEILPLDILYEDEHLVVVNKAAGMVVHPSHGHERGTLVNALLGYCGDTLSGINGVLRPGIVHRLDKDTSGVMVVAKSDKAHRGLAAQFADHGRTGPLERRYRAVVWGALPRASGTIEAGIARSTQNRERMVVSKAESARFAITHYGVEKDVSGEKGVIASLITCELETGRTHQIRVHLTHIGNPLLGDPLYGTGFRTREKHLPEKARIALAKLGRQALHAEYLAFEHPVTKAFMAFERQAPDDLAALELALFG